LQSDRIPNVREGDTVTAELQNQIINRVKSDISGGQGHVDGTGYSQYDDSQGLDADVVKVWNHSSNDNTIPAHGVAYVGGVWTEALGGPDGGFNDIFYCLSNDNEFGGIHYFDRSCLYVVNDHVPIVPGAVGRAYAVNSIRPRLALYDTQFSEPDVGSTVGISATLHKLGPGLPGFIYVGGGIQNEKIYVIRDTMTQSGRGDTVGYSGLIVRINPTEPDIGAIYAGTATEDELDVAVGVDHYVGASGPDVAEYNMPSGFEIQYFLASTSSANRRGCARYMYLDDPIGRGKLWDGAAGAIPNGWTNTGTMGSYDIITRSS
jgi:hypothetical protein